MRLQLWFAVKNANKARCLSESPDNTTAFTADVQRVVLKNFKTAVSLAQ